MKTLAANIKTFVVVMMLLVSLPESGFSQSINWRALHEDQRNIIDLNVGYEYGATAQLGYGRAFVLLGRPALLDLEYSFPMGRVVLDDFKVKLGGQVEILQLGGFSATARIQSIFRRYENAMVRIVSFGSDFAAVAGYYRPTWHAAGEFGFDKSITSHLKHSDVMRQYYPSIKDGWYIPSGGNYYYGIQVGKTLGESLDLSLRLGATNAQFDDENAVLPYYAQLGLGIRF